LIELIDLFKKKFVKMKYCTNHPDRLAYSVCGNCKESYCKECLNEGDQFLYCNKRECVKRYGPVYVDSQTVPQSISDLLGVKGWLFLFALQLTVLTPIWSLISIARNFNDLSPVMDAFPSVLGGVVIDMIMILSVIGFGIYCGILIFNLKTQAIILAKRYLIVFFIFSILEFPIFIAFSGLPAEVNKIILGESVGGIFRALIYVIIWYLYLTKSKRVKNTFTPYQTFDNEPKKSPQNEFSRDSQTDQQTFQENKSTSVSSNFSNESNENLSKNYDLEQYEEINDNELSEVERDRIFAKALGLKGKLTKFEIKRIYKDLIEKYHPDKVSHLGEEFQVYALKKTKDINKAYNYFKKKYNII